MPIQILGKPALLQKSISVQKGDESIDKLVTSMWEIMGKLNGVVKEGSQIKTIYHQLNLSK